LKYPLFAQTTPRRWLWRHKYSRHYNSERHFLWRRRGASTQASGSVASSGGNGGGIVIIIADTIDGNNHIIRSNGITAANAVSNAGAGGGGAGAPWYCHSRDLPARSVCQQTEGTEVQSGGFGEGGGGGGGLIWLSSANLPAMVSNATVAYGTPAPTTPSEGTGEIKYSLIPRLNGFLFNYIRTRATDNKVDSVCSNTMYGQIVGTQPVGGTPPYTYVWERSTTSETTGFTPAPGTNNQQYYTPPSLLSQTTWFRRVVRITGCNNRCKSAGKNHSSSVY